MKISFKLLSVVLLINFLTGCSFFGSDNSKPNLLRKIGTSNSDLTENPSSIKNLPPLRIDNASIKANVLSNNKVLISWATNRLSKGRVDLHLLRADGYTNDEYQDHDYHDYNENEIESTQHDIYSEYPSLNNYKQHRIMLIDGEGIELLPGRKYSFTVYAWLDDADLEENNEVQSSGPEFETKEDLDLAIFIQNNHNEILTFPFPNDNANLKPTYKISNPLNHVMVNSAYDSMKDILYFTLKNVNGILVFTNLKNESLASETRIIEGNNTRISTPSALFIDEQNDTLYVANRGSNSVVVFRQASLLAGNIGPNRVLSGTKTWIKNPTGLVLDLARDVMYLSCATRTGDTVLSFYPASTIEGDTPATAKLYGKETRIDKPVSLTFDQNKKQLYVLNGTDEVLVFNEHTGKTYNPESNQRLTGKRVPDRIIKNLNWEMTFSPSDFGGIIFDSNKDRLYLSGKPEGHSKAIVNVFNDASTLNGPTQISSGIQGSNSTVSAMGISLDSSSQVLFAVSYNDLKESVVSLFDITNIETGNFTPISTKAQVSAFKSDISGLFYQKTTQSLFVLSGDYLTFSVESLLNSWNYYNADQVFKKSLSVNDNIKDFSNFSKIKIDERRNILYSMDKTNNFIVAFDGIGSHSGLVVDVLPSRIIIPYLHNQSILDFTLNEEKDELYVLMAPMSGTNRNLSVALLKEVSSQDGDAVINKILKVTAIPNTAHNNDGMCIEIDPTHDKLFVSVPRRIEIFANLSTLVGGQIPLEPSKVISKTQSRIGIPKALYFYQPENTKHTSYLLVANSSSAGIGENNILGFDNTALDSQMKTVTPVFQLQSPDMNRPLSISVGNLK